ncbi:MAG: gfo/Idh/MocA family oxidoreductase, partial [Chloroflexi bacterium]|nr:gfo/Idh/MocA family oxidoreductase [Chloroflexota bacterium]
HFSTDEFNGWIGEGGGASAPDSHGRARRSLAGVSGQEEIDLRTSVYAYKGLGDRAPSGPQNQPRFGVMVVSCERGDLRPTANGVAVYTAEGMRETPIPPGRGVPGRGDVMDELYNAVVNGAPLVHDARWGKATVEVCLAILESARTQQEITLKHQVALPAGAYVGS